ncbi:MAG TPA: KpsF/GutQ family sugar-phosphate isomerase, partial [Planctomycetota bacterium]|nr:KpsF/GutQ family sugar-phosphate isomerase [Planctomycetota bacterium]
MDSRLECAREVLAVEANAIERLRERLGDPSLRAGESFLRAADAVLRCTGRVVLTGMGKAGKIAEKISATLASTGTPSLFLHPAEAVHGDLGRCLRDDLVIALSNSGETEEIVRLVPAVRQIGARLVAVTGASGSTLAREADVVLDLGAIEEACPLGLAPTASTAVMLALGDALAMVVLQSRGFTKDDFALYHPSGAIGRTLLRVRERMRSGDAFPVVKSGAPVRDALGPMGTKGRAGAA